MQFSPARPSPVWTMVASQSVSLVCIWDPNVPQYVDQREGNPYLFQVPDPRLDIDVVSQQVDRLLFAAGNNHECAARKLQAGGFVVWGHLLENGTCVRPINDRPSHNSMTNSDCKECDLGGEHSQQRDASTSQTQIEELTAHLEKPALLHSGQSFKMLTI